MQRYSLLAKARTKAYAQLAHDRCLMLQLFLLLLGCSAENGQGDAMPDSFGSDGAETTCHDLLNEGSPVQTIQVAETRPSPVGGEIQDGVYVRVANTVYTGLGGTTGPLDEPVSEAQSYANGQVDFVTQQQGNESRGTHEYTVMSPYIFFVSECPFQGGVPPLDSYTATANSLLLFGYVGDVGLVLEYRLTQAF
jgi:hypothetical protein